MYRSIKITELKAAKPQGYIYFIDSKHPLATGNSGRVYYHRHVASISLGRWLSSSEVVHHIDKDITNNDIANLLVCSSAEHTKIHKPKCLFKHNCLSCFKQFETSAVNSKFCSKECANYYTVKDKSITKEYLEPLLWSFPAIKVSKLIGYSDVGVKKLARRLGCIMPPPYFHNKGYSAEFKLEQYDTAKEV